MSRRPLLRLLALLLALCQLTGPLAHAQYSSAATGEAPAVAHCHDSVTQDHPDQRNDGRHCALCAQGCSCAHAASIVMPLPVMGSAVAPMGALLPYPASPFLAPFATRLFRPPDLA